MKTRGEYIEYFEAIRQATPELFEKMVENIAKFEPEIAEILNLKGVEQ